MITNMSVLNDIEPLYIKNNDLPSKDLKPIDICYAAANKIGVGKIDGAQRIRNIWRLYLKDKRARAELFTKQTIVIDGRVVQLYDRNPISNIKFNNKPSEKITVRDIPFLTSNDEIKKAIEDLGVIFISNLKDSYERDKEGNITGYRNGDRFAYIEPVESPIKRNVQIGDHVATIIHHGKDNRPCRACNQVGHKFGSENCPAIPKSPIYAFKSFEHPLSNHYPCKLLMFQEEFKSYEHALFWKMATDLNKPHLATRIKDSVHAGVAKTLSNEMEEEAQQKWEDSNDTLIRNMLYEKFKQVQAFRQCLIDNRDKQFAEAGRNLRWATGLSPYVSEKTAPEFWPGLNYLGALLTEMADQSEDLLLKIEQDQICGSATNEESNCGTDDEEESSSDLQEIDQQERGRSPQRRTPEAKIPRTTKKAARRHLPSPPVGASKLEFEAKANEQQKGKDFESSPDGPSQDSKHF